MKDWFKTGSPWVWLSAGGVSLSLISVVGLLWLIASNGLSYFWPSKIHQFNMVDEKGQQLVVIGEVYDRERIPASQLSHVDLGVEITEDTIERLLVKTGNRELVSLDFRWILAPQITERSLPADVAVVERRSNGNFYGFVEKVILDGQEADASKLDELLERVNEFQEEISELQKVDIGAINYNLERLRLRERKYIIDGELTDEVKAELDAQAAELRKEYEVLEKDLMALRSQVSRDQVVMRAMGGELVTINFDQIIKISFNNQLSFFGKVATFFDQIAGFIFDEPREANTEGGVFPAIFGTVLMVLLMTVIVAPFGVIAAIYLHEYAAKNAFTKLIRIAVINLAGVPSIVYGVFGLGFFVYMVGGNLDRLFYPETLPSPTFGTPGVLWSALTLAILTLPVVIVSTEEGLARIPSSMRHGSLALGATKAETLWRIILPIASPAIMTGIILAIARAAGEVAPLMLVGVVKMAPTLPLDGNFPFLHLERKFMHLGFHIYDVGFQSPNVEAARPLVYATALLLVTIIVSLNMTAVNIRNKLREKYRALEH
ncbi:phosphate ABC transporter permease PstA [Thalassotalea euphylliae]|uniref:Phosphate transport system permease protein PstA n=1 Tax=Thalassotalea euphylliae TaxID=1655234 RepID=A0A3E0UHP3_9GAMM|nr:phosphate ABC transporter permease PstA [Thalassotalea euphylliae]REL36400.1 phosphate ABC transporter permease PstA [Thalassotalea euphylliae]